MSPAAPLAIALAMAAATAAAPAPPAAAPQVPPGQVQGRAVIAPVIVANGPASYRQYSPPGSAPILPGPPPREPASPPPPVAPASPAPAAAGHPGRPPEPPVVSSPEPAAPGSQERAPEPPIVEDPMAGHEVIAAPAAGGEGLYEDPEMGPSPEEVDERRRADEIVEMGRRGNQPNMRQMLEEALLKRAPVEMTFQNAPLAEVIRFFAEACGIQYLGLPDDDGRTVTLSCNDNPWKMLKNITTAHAVSIIYEDGVWIFRPLHDKELLARTYQLKFATQDTTDASGATGSTGAGIQNQGAGVGSAMSGTAGGRYGYSGYGGSGGVGGAGYGGGGVPMLSTPTKTFKPDATKLIEDIEEILGIPKPQPKIVFGEVSYGDVTRQAEVFGDMVDAGEQAAGEEKKTVKYHPDANILFVVATRQQHEWVQTYLDSMDLPQRLIAIEVKFVETNRDPKKEMGIDWSGTLSGGYDVELSDLDMTWDMNRLGDLRMPTEAIISPQALQAKIKLFFTDRDSSTVSYPRQVTVNNKEAVIRTVVQVPVLASQSSISASGSGTETAGVAYLPVGTTINILPKIVGEGDVLLNVIISVSNIVGSEKIKGESYPVTSARDYNGQAIVKSGYTLAIGGLEETIDSKTWAKIPWLGDIPFFGFAFKSKDTSRSKKFLMMFVTPVILDGYTGKERAIEQHNVIPADGPREPRVPYDGRAVRTLAELAPHMRDLDRDVRTVEQLAKERDATPENIRSCEDLQREIYLMLRVYKHAGRSAELPAAARLEQEMLQAHADRLARARYLFSAANM